MLCKDCIICQLNKPHPNQKQIAKKKQDFKRQSLYFIHRILFDTKGPISPSSEANFYIMVIVDAFTHYVALNPEPHCNAFCAYTTIYEHWLAKFGLPEILVTDNALNSLTTKLSRYVTYLISNKNHVHLMHLAQTDYYNTIFDVLLMKMIHNIPNGQQIKNYSTYLISHKLQQH